MGKRHRALRFAAWHRRASSRCRHGRSDTYTLEQGRGTMPSSSLRRTAAWRLGMRQMDEANGWGKFFWPSLSKHSPVSQVRMFSGHTLYDVEEALAKNKGGTLRVSKSRPGWANIPARGWSNSEAKLPLRTTGWEHWWRQLRQHHMEGNTSSCWRYTEFGCGER